MNLNELYDEAILALENGVSGESERQKVEELLRLHPNAKNIYIVKVYSLTRSCVQLWINESFSAEDGWRDFETRRLSELRPGRALLDFTELGYKIIRIA